jgi:tetratricopeptide (TPR) repeat protein
MQSATALLATRCPGGVGQVLIKRQQLLVKPGIGQHGLVQGAPPATDIGEMAKIGRNDLCPCGSGKKYKRCCLAQDVAAARSAAVATTPTTAATTEQRYPNLCQDCGDRLDDAASAVFALIDARQFDQAERAAHDVLAQFPDMHDGYECLGRLHQAKGDYRQACDYYRKVIAFAEKNPDLYDPGFVGYFRDLIDRLEPLTTAD